MQFLLLSVLALRRARLSGTKLLHVDLFHLFIYEYMQKFGKISEDSLVKLIF